MILAYLDPGTGSLLLQAVLAIVLSTGVLLRRYVLMPFQWLCRRREKPPELYE